VIAGPHQRRTLSGDGHQQAWDVSLAIARVREGLTIPARGAEVSARIARVREASTVQVNHPTLG